MCGRDVAGLQWAEYSNRDLLQLRDHPLIEATLKTVRKLFQFIYHLSQADDPGLGLNTFSHSLQDSQFRE